MIEETVTIQTKDAANLREVGRVLRRGPAKLVGPKGEQAVLSKPLHNLLKDIVRRLSDGRRLVVMPEEKQLTTQEAGELLGMSRPYLIRLLDAEQIPYHLVGKHRRIALRDVLAYAKRRSEGRRAALDKMARDAYDAGLYDNKAIPKGGRDE